MKRLLFALAPALLGLALGLASIATGNDAALAGTCTGTNGTVTGTSGAGGGCNQALVNAGGSMGSSAFLAPVNTFPATIAASGSWQSGVIVSFAPAVLATVKSTQNGALTIQRYADLLGVVPVGSAITQAITANTLATAAVNDGLPFASLQVTVTNTGGSTATITNASILAGPR